MKIDELFKATYACTHRAADLLSASYNKGLCAGAELENRLAGQPEPKRGE